MYEKLLGVVSAVVYTDFSERHIANNHIKMVIWELCLLKALYSDIGFLIELLCNPARKFVNFYAVELASCHTVGKQTEEIACAAGRLQDIPL